ncbi:MAG TPA: hypothetical protein VNS19_05135 [Acidimicrobiales bacterium]|nr:hypothetical protein [Acidimicrobiales bacterium]
MIQIRHRIAAVVCAGLVAPVAIGASSAGAIDQDLVVSASAGAPGDVIDVSSASCAPINDPSVDSERFVRVLLISGTGSEQVLAGMGSGLGAASLLVPDWVDPAEPAVIEASCVTGTFSFDGYEETAEAYDPVAFDVLPGAGAPTQTSGLSRSEVLVGQSLLASGTGCSATDDFGGVDLSAGDDLSGRSFDDTVAFGDGMVEGGSFDARVDLIDRSWSVGWSSSGPDGRPFDIEAEGSHTEIAAGTYTAFSYCGSYDDATDTELYLVLPPQLVEITGDAPIDDLAVDVEAGTPNATVVGGSCTSDSAEGEIEGYDLIAAQQEWDRLEVAPERAPSPLRPGTEAAGAAGTGTASSETARLVGHEDYVPFSATPAADGSWSTQETADFEVGVLFANATCGDPLADGFFYDTQAGVVEVPEAPVTVPTTVPAAPAPAGATPVTGTPDYAG